MSNQLLAHVDGHGFILPQRSAYEFETSPPKRQGDDCIIVVEGRDRVHCRYVVGETGSAGILGWLVKVNKG